VIKIKDKMIKFICDQCKVNETKLSLTIKEDEYDRSAIEIYDICKTCLAELKKILGTGRKYPLK
jgi:hypothetical protein